MQKETSIEAKREIALTISEMAKTRIPTFYIHVYTRGVTEVRHQPHRRRVTENRDKTNESI